MNYRVNEIFESIQGEGVFTGTPAIFIRLQGCDVGCSWCDTMHTWDRNAREVTLNEELDSIAATTMNEKDIVENVVTNYAARHVVITGGEPALYDLNVLASCLISRGLSAQIETSGTVPIDKLLPDAWLTVSPKIGMPGGRKVQLSVLNRANEIKMPVGRQRDIDLLKKDILPNVSSLAIVSLQPLSQSESATRKCIDEATANGWKVSFQSHKWAGIR